MHKTESGGLIDHSGLNILRMTPKDAPDREKKSKGETGNKINEQRFWQKKQDVVQMDSVDLYFHALLFPPTKRQNNLIINGVFSPVNYANSLTLNFLFLNSFTPLLRKIKNNGFNSSESESKGFVVLLFAPVFKTCN